MELGKVKNMIDRFIPYDESYISSFKLSNASIYSYKVERVGKDVFYIEIMLENESHDKYLVLQNIWYLSEYDKLILPEVLGKLNKDIREIVYAILRMIIFNADLQKNVTFMTSDVSYLLDLELNRERYTWENGIPVTPYINLNALLRIITRYLFLEKIINGRNKILEAASGFGYGAAYLSKLTDSTVYGLDISENAIEFSKKAYPLTNIKWIIGDVTDLPFEDNFFDFYISFETLEHLPLNVTDKYLEEAKRVLKPSGKFIISTPNREARNGINNPFHVKEYNFEELDDLLKKYFSRRTFFSIFHDLSIVKGVNNKASNFLVICFN